MTTELNQPSATPRAKSPHPLTVDLVRRFAAALLEKLTAAEQKYGYTDGWASPDWMDECRQKLLEHVTKGDPRDVATYCAFLWHHGASTSKPDGPDSADAARYRLLRRYMVDSAIVRGKSGVFLDEALDKEMGRLASWAAQGGTILSGSAADVAQEFAMSQFATRADRDAAMLEEIARLRAGNASSHGGA